MDEQQKALRASMFERGLFVENMTDDAKLRALVNSIKPQRSPHPLVRIGGDNDGGYLVPDDLQGIQACFSPGVANNASFEIDMLARGVASHLADYSVDGPPPGLQAKSFSKKFLGSLNNDVYITLDQWVKDLADPAQPGDYLLQMDIEGAEYETILASSVETLRQFRIIVLEVHNVDSWGSTMFFRMVQAMFDKLLGHFNVVHCHPNNWCGLVNLRSFPVPKVFELTFLRKDRGDTLGPVEAMPHPLDRPNIAWWPDMVLPREWY